MPARATVGRNVRISGVTLLALFAWFAATAWLRPLSLPDEGRYVGIAWEMLRSGNWLVPTLDTLPYFHKPPLFYWTTAAALATFGVNEWAARLTSLLAATGSAFAVYIFMQRWANEVYARIALVVLATTPFFFGAAQFANMDMLVTGCMTGTVLGAANAVLCLENNRPHRPTLAAAYGFAALGILAKGLIGVVIPALVIGAWLVSMGRPALILKLLWLPGMALAAAITVPWFVLMHARYPGFLDYIVVHHHFQRFTTQEFNGKRPFWFYLPVFVAFTLPWCLLVPAALRRDAGADGLRPAISSLMWIWLVATLVFYSIPSSKLVGYVLFAVPPLAVLVADAVLRLAGGSVAKAMLRTKRFAVAAVVLCAAVFAGAMVRERDHAGQLVADVRRQFKPDDLVVSMRNYPFSAPFYLRLREPVLVVEDWDDATVTHKDNWRRELHEAAKFDPARAETVLLRQKSLRHILLCSRKTVWVFGSEEDSTWYQGLASLERFAHNSHGVVWRSQPASSPQRHPDCGP